MKYRTLLLMLIIMLFGCSPMNIADKATATSVKITPVTKSFAQGDNEGAYTFIGFDCDFSFEPYNLGLGTSSTEQTLCIWLDEPVNKHVKDKGISYEMGATYSNLPMKMNEKSTHNVFCIIDGLNVNGWTLEEAEKLLLEMDTLYITIKADGKTISTQYVEIIK